MSATEPAVRKTTGSTKLLAAFVLLATFLAGIAIGLAGDRALMMRQRDRRPPRGSEFLIHRLDRQLNLTPQQETQIRTILAAREQRIQSIWSTVRPEVRREIDQTNAEIARVLTPDQRREFEKIKMRMVPRHGTPMMPH